MYRQAPYVAPRAAPGAAAPPPPPPPHPLHPPRPLDLSVVPPDDRDAAVEYDAFLAELTFNSKDVITSLTRVAGENLGAAAGIAATIEQRAFTAAPHAKLPFLYLVDSIVKNIGAAYIACFARNLFHTFTAAYAVAPLQLRMSMHRLLNTWPPIFGMELVTAMRRRAADYDSAPPPAPPASQPPMYDFRSAAPPASRDAAIPPPRDGAIPPSADPPMSQSMPIPMPLHSQPMALQSQPMPLRPQPMPLRPQPMSLRSQPMLRSQPSLRAQPSLGAVPVINSGPPQQQPAAPPTEQFLHTQTLMADITRKASMAIPPSNRQLFTINRLITTQLQTSPPPPLRDQLLSFQQQLRDISSGATPAQPPPFPSPAAAQAPVPSHPALPALPAHPARPVHPTLPALSSLPPTTTAALTGLLRALPQSIVAPQAPPSSLPPPPVPRRPPPTAPVFHAPMPPTLKFAQLKTISHAATVRAMYTELPHLSKSDGMRFATKEGLREHLDWLFKQNRRKRARSQNLSTGGMSRCWYDKLSVFLHKDSHLSDSLATTGSAMNPSNSVNANDTSVSRGPYNGAHGPHNSDNGETDRTQGAVESRGENETCPACQEEFESFWDDDRQSWMLREATRTDDGQVYHSRCVVLTDATPTKSEPSTPRLSVASDATTSPSLPSRKHKREETVQENFGQGNSAEGNGCQPEEHEQTKKKLKVESENGATVAVTVTPSVQVKTETVATDVSVKE